LSEKKWAAAKKRLKFSAQVPIRKEKGEVCLRVPVFVQLSVPSGIGASRKRLRVAHM